MPEENINFELEATSNGSFIAFAELNSIKSLNALSLTMIEQLKSKLDEWQLDESIVAVLLLGAGEKAFCAGGDVVSVCRDLQQYQSPLSDEKIADEQIKSSLAADFFQKEYQLDLLIHNYTKPIIVWADGYVMGGGVGLMAGASHRICTEKTKMSMPEITIGLYPDVGASYFLNKMPNNIGLFLGLTGAIINGSDAKYLGLADYLVSNHAISKLEEKLFSLDWQKNKQDFKLIDEVLLELDQNYFSSGLLPESPARKNEELIKQVTNFVEIKDIYKAITEAEQDDPWFKKAQNRLSKGSSLSACIIHQQLSETSNKTLEQCFTLEYNLSLRCCQYPEFSEGVRALLIDKDHSPKWAYSTVEKVDKKLLDWFFTTI